MNLQVKGLVKVGNMRFHQIEGGFGVDKRAMLVKEIAEIHGQDFGEINRRINDNMKRFKIGVDILDIKANGFEPLGHCLGFTKQSFNQSKNIYLLSERGYSKLLKILEDDVAWSQYDKIVDGYFNMRRAIKENNISLVSQEDKKKLIDAKYNNSLARKANVLLKLADKPEVTGTYKQIIYSHASAIITGKLLLPLPEVTEKTLSADEVGKVIGISAAMVGRITNKNNLKTEQYGKWFHDKSKHSSKEVETFKYFENVIPTIEKIRGQNNG